MTKKILNPTVAVDADTLLDLMMRAARYDVGGKTGMADSTARTIMLTVTANRDLFDEGRLRRLAADIRENISRNVAFYKNVRTEHEWNHCNRFDAYSRIAEVLERHPDYRFNELDFSVDCEGGEVTVTHRDRPVAGLVNRDLHDPFIEPWVKLANVLDRSKWWRVTVEYDGRTETLTCIGWPQGVQEYDEKLHETTGYTYRTVYTPIGKASGSSWIAENCIKEVEPYEEEEGQ